MTAPIPRPIGLNKRSGPLFGLPAGPAADGIAAAKEEAVVVEEAPKAPEEPTPPSGLGSTFGLRSQTGPKPPCRISATATRGRSVGAARGATRSMHFYRRSWTMP